MHFNDYKNCDGNFSGLFIGLFFKQLIYVIKKKMLKVVSHNLVRNIK